MNKSHALAVWPGGLLLAALLLCFASRSVSSHCDTLAGPVIEDARAALAKNDVTPVLKWVPKEFEGEVRNAFASTIAVRHNGGEAAGLADQYFFETVVRIHRAGEGAPYTGLKDDPVDPVIQMAEDALGLGSPEDMIQKLKAHMEAVVREKFTVVAEAAKTKDKSVEQGRKYVAAYVTYMHYLEGLHEAIVSTGVHQHDTGDTPSGHEE